MAGSTVKIPTGLKKLDSKVIKAVNTGMDEITADLLRVATLRSPVDEGTLEHSGTSKVMHSNSMIKGYVSFSARNKSFNYALKMDRGNYKLGKKSLAKSGRGVRSKFGKAVMKVGKGYLTDSAEQCTDGYVQHINQMVGKGVLSSGLRIK